MAAEWWWLPSGGGCRVAVAAAAAAEILISALLTSTDFSPHAEPLSLTPSSLPSCLSSSGHGWPHSGSQSPVDGRLTTGFSVTKLEPPSRPNSYWDEPQYQPFFDESVVRNVTAQLGKAAHLRCKIHQLADRTVSETTRWTLLLVASVSEYRWDQRMGRSCCQRLSLSPPGAC